MELELLLYTYKISQALMCTVAVAGAAKNEETSESGVARYRKDGSAALFKSGVNKCFRPTMTTQATAPLETTDWTMPPPSPIT